MEVRAQAKHIPMSAQKVRLVLDRVRGMHVEDALELLPFLPQAAAKPVEKVIRSAVANAEENIGLSREDLYIAHIVADEGPGVAPGKGRRPRFGGRGRYRPIRRRSAHITVVLDEWVEE
ncbi:MAG: 50S ribosomal protein L22 [Anaerolineae bacterium]|jgi:large subunit ribosomal protein L22